MYLWYPIVLSHEEVNKLMRKDLIICLTNLGYVHCVIIRKKKRQTDRQRKRLTEKQTDRQTEKQTDRETDRQTEKQTDRETDRQRKRQTEKKTEKQTGRQTDRERLGYEEKRLF